MKMQMLSKHGKVLKTGTTKQHAASLLPCTIYLRNADISSPAHSCTSTHGYHRMQNRQPLQRQRVCCQAGKQDKFPRQFYSGERPALPAEVERSDMVNEELVYFIFQLDLDTQLQRALNYEAFEAAKEVRARRQKVDEAVEEMKQRKAEAAAGGAASSGTLVSAVDLATEGLRLRAAMAAAVAQENYKEAAAIKTKLSALEAQSLQAELRAAQMKGGVSFTPTFRLGQRVWHTQHGYRGVVVGWDARCCESEDWLKASGHADKSLTQPWYHLLVHEPDWESNAYEPPVVYVPQESLWAPEQGGQLPPAAATAAMKANAGGAVAVKPDADYTIPKDTSWIEVFGPGQLDHPYLYILFLGKDARGDYMPCRQLRDKYNVARRDVYKPGETGEENDHESN